MSWFRKHMNRAIVFHRSSTYTTPSFGLQLRNVDSLLIIFGQIDSIIANPCHFSNLETDWTLVQACILGSSAQSLSFDGAVTALRLHDKPVISSKSCRTWKLSSKCLYYSKPVLTISCFSIANISVFLVSIPIYNLVIPFIANQPNDRYAQHPYCGYHEHVEFVDHCLALVFLLKD